MTPFTESIAEQAALDWLEELGYSVLHGPDIAPGEPAEERREYRDVVIEGRLRDAVRQLNPHLSQDAVEDVIRSITSAESPSLLENNRRFHRLFTEGVAIQYQGEDGPRSDIATLVDFERPENNDWLAVNQFTVIEGEHNRRPDIVVFVNGLPLVVIEMKNPADEKATIRTAYHQLQTYKAEIPGLFPFNEILIVSDGLEARHGTLTADWSRFMPWRTIGGKELAPKGQPELETLIKGIFEKKRLLDIIRYFIVCEDTEGAVVKKMAAYHQYHAVNRAVDATVQASSPEGDKRVGVVWHTQGSGKSLTMTFYAGKIIMHPAMENPTIVVLTDRNDLDDQLFGMFCLDRDLLRQDPVQAKHREHLKELLQVASGGVIFTTIQKFLPQVRGTQHSLLSDRRNIVFIADEAHRSQYDFMDGFARHMRDALPNASFIGFTGTPIEKADRSTPAVFGNYIDIYDIHRAVEDEVTVRIYYEGRLAKIALDEAERPKIDPDFEEVTEGEEETTKEKLKSKWARLEAMVGSENRIRLVAQDIVNHFEERQKVMEGKAMIVCMSRRICVELYKELVNMRPHLHDADDRKGMLKVVMTGSASDPLDWQQHIRNKQRRKELAERFKNPKTPFQIAIVRDMWLTGFDAPCLHTMYFDKPMRGHGLMQAIARVNRVFKDKPGGLIVDYLGIADQLKKALAEYTEQDRSEVLDQAEAVAIMLEKYEIASAMFHGFDYRRFFGGNAADQLAVVKEAAEHILAQQDGKKRLLQSVTELSRAYALAVPHEKAIEVRDDVGFFQAVRAALAKATPGLGQRTQEDLDAAVRQIISHAIVSDDVVDIFAAAGLKKPDISILSEEFLAEVRSMPQRNLAIEMLRRLIDGEIKTRSKRNVVQARSFAEMLEETIRKYQNRTIEAAQVIAELIALAKEMQAADRRGEEIGLSEEELAFYDALEVNDSAVKVLGDETLKTIARELVETVRKNATIDWTVKENARAKLRTMVRRLLRQHGYPPDKQEKATKMVLEQAEAIAKEWVG